jgi:uncharacterized protein YcbX
MINNNIESILVYPIKGFSSQRLVRAALQPGRGLVGDRRFALRHGASAYDPARPAWHGKRAFVVLAHGPAPATVATAFDADTGVLRIARDGQQLFVGNVLTDAGRRAAAFVLGRAVKDARGPVDLIDAGAVSLTDIATPALSIINRASVDDLAAKIGFALDPIRFRGNLIIAGARPWIEFDWVGREIRVGDAVLKVMKRIQRCAATSVDPATATRDINVPAALQSHFGHLDCGIYAEVTAPGTVRAGDAVTLL